MDGQDKGVLLREIKSSMRMGIDRFDLIILLVCILIVAWAPITYYTYDFAPPADMVPAILAQIPLGVFAYFFCNWLMVPQLSYVRIFSNGIERKRTAIEWLRKQPALIHKNNIDRVELTKAGGKNIYGAFFITRIILKDGKKVRFPNLQADQENEFGQLIRDQLGVKITVAGDI